jgi:hypothetical protein
LHDSLSISWSEAANPTWDAAVRAALAVGAVDWSVGAVDGSSFADV